MSRSLRKWFMLSLLVLSANVAYGITNAASATRTQDESACGSQCDWVPGKACPSGSVCTQCWPNLFPPDENALPGVCGRF